MLIKLFVVILSVFIWQPVFAQPSDSYSPPTCGFLKKVTPLQIDGVAMTELEIEEENGNIVYFHIDPTNENAQSCTKIKGPMCWDINGWIRYQPNKRSRFIKRLYFIENCVAAD